MIISPTSVTNFSRTRRELEAFWLFSLFVAGKNSDFAAKKVEAVYDQCPVNMFLFDWLRLKNIEEVLRIAKVGQYNRLSRAISESLDLDLRTVSLSELLNIFGVGGKTARFFLLHSRKDCKCAVLDTHVLKFLRNNGFPDAPTQTPPVNKYSVWETVFLSIIKSKYPQTSVADADLMIWKEYSGRV